MKLALPAGSTSVICHVFIPDSTSTAGAGKTALAYSDITAYYVRAGGALTALTMVDVTTLGTWDTDVTDDKLGLKKLHDTNAPGLYEVHLPNNILVAGSTSVVIQLRATGAAPTMIEVQLAGVDVAQVSNDATAADNLELMFDGTGYAGGTTKLKVDVETIKTQAVTCAAGVTVLASVGTAATSTAQTGDSYAIVNSGTYGNSALKTLIDAVDDFIDTEVAAIKAKTDNLPASPAAVGSAMTLANGAVTAAAVATGAIDADALAADAVDEILDEVVEGTTTLREAIRLFLSVLTGKSSGGGTATIVFRDIGDTKDRIIATVDADGNRLAVGTRDGS